MAVNGASSHRPLEHIERRSFLLVLREGEGHGRDVHLLSEGSCCLLEMDVMTDGMPTPGPNIPFWASDNVRQDGPDCNAVGWFGVCATAPPSSFDGAAAGVSRLWMDVVTLQLKGHGLGAGKKNAGCGRCARRHWNRVATGSLPLAVLSFLFAGGV